MTMKRRERGSNNRTTATLVLVVAVLFAAACLQQAPRITVPLTAVETAPPVPARETKSTFATFSHKVEEHKQFECISCHRREGKSRDLEFAAHDACIGCHLNQFINPERAMCSICHVQLEADPPPTKPFPAKFKEGFNMKFDHASHDRGAGKPPDGCNACHRPNGPGMTIPASITAHANCYGCHTAESKLNSCSVCHALAPYSRTPPSRYVFKSVFRHSDHSIRQGVSCNECHNVVAGAGQGRQVTHPTAVQHRSVGGVSCRTCHNDRRAFGDESFANCAKCHKGSGFDMLPGS
jgi:c(7)-type cytochrome triheme protein